MVFRPSPNPDNYEDWNEWARDQQAWLDEKLRSLLNIPFRIHYFGDPGEPPFYHNFSNPFPGAGIDYENFGFWKDENEIVWLRGTFVHPGSWAPVIFPVIAGPLPADHSPAFEPGQGVGNMTAPVWWASSTLRTFYVVVIYLDSGTIVPAPGADGWYVVCAEGDTGVAPPPLVTPTNDGIGLCTPVISWPAKKTV